MDDALPLPTLLSAALVAFTIEFDNEFEHRMVHRTTTGWPPARAQRGPWLVSQVMWSNVMQYVDPGGVRVDELRTRARTNRDSLAGLRRWGYVTFEPTPPGQRKTPTSDTVIRPTAAGRQAQEAWRPLAGIVESRWRDRFGAAGIDALRQSLRSLLGQIDARLPDYLPPVYPTQNGKAEIPTAAPPLAPPSAPPSAAASEGGAGSGPDLSVLLSQVLLAFTVEFEDRTKISLPISATTLRVLDEEGIRVRDLPALTGVSKEGNAMSLGFLARHDCALVGTDPATGRGRLARLTAQGRKAQLKYIRVLRDTERQWEARFGADRIDVARTSLAHLVGNQPTAESSPLFRGLVPYPEGWRASVPTSVTLPHYPMVLHRGGFPDGS
jgi:DNA-binding MarR family transcriptional regulator